MELVSIVIPVYGVEEYLDKCMQSVLDQSYPNLEIILVDDGSPDRCGEMCDRYAEKDTRIKVVHKINGGLSDARNEGVKYATGKYLLFIDSDDYVREDLVELTVRAAEEQQAEMVVFAFTEVEDGGTLDVTNDLPEYCTFTLAEHPQMIFMPPNTWARLFNREFFLRVKHDFPVGRYYEDLGTTPKFLLDAQRITYVNQCLYYYVSRSGSIMKSRNFERNYKDIIWILEDIRAFYRSRGVYEKYRDELEYLFFIHAYFEPIKIITLADFKNPYLDKFRKYMYGEYPDFRKNRYMKLCDKKDKIRLLILDAKQYWLMYLISKCWRYIKRLRRARQR
jgi:glycosyltransferase involved in cell wall biosynthesis